MRVVIGNDHRGVGAKEKLLAFVEQLGHEVHDCGAANGESADYPDIAAVVSREVSSGNADRGILICGSGIGMAITANKFPGIRAAVCSDEATAELCRQHNDVNVLCLSGEMSVEPIVKIWLTTEFEGGRHARRVGKIGQIEQNCGTDHDAGSTCR